MISLLSSNICLGASAGPARPGRLASHSVCGNMRMTFSESHWFAGSAVLAASKASGDSTPNYLLSVLAHLSQTPDSLFAQRLISAALASGSI